MSRLPARRAATSPVAIIAAGAGMAVGVLAGLPVVGFAVLGAAGWGVAVAVRLARRPRPERIDPFTVGAEWRRPVHGALKAQRRFREALAKARPGPLRDRLAEIGERIDTGVMEAWGIAQRGDELEDGLRALDVPRTERALANEELAETRLALEAQLASARRVADAITSARDRLRLLEARLGEAVSRAVELSLRSTDGVGASALGADVETVVNELESLRAALEDVDRPGGTSTA